MSSLGDPRMPFPVPPALEHPELLSYRDEFPLLQQKTYFSNASLGALSQRSMQNMQRFMEIWNEKGASAWSEHWFSEITNLRQKFATLIGAQTHEVAITPSASVALSIIASALDYKTRNKVIVSDMDFPTLSYQWLAKQRVGIDCQIITSPDHVYMPTDLFEQAIDQQTALIATSRVYHNSGYIQDIRTVANVAHKHGAYLLVDDYQGTGQIPLNVNTLDIDFLVTGTSKWLLGGPGLAFLYIREGLLPTLEPTIAGWFGHRKQSLSDAPFFALRNDATRTELGTPAMAAVYSAHGGLDIVLEASVESICERTRYLTNDLIARAREQGWETLVPQEPELRSSIVTIALDDAETIARTLASHQILVDARPNHLRLSPYFYNTIDENAIVIEAINRSLHKP